MNLEKFLEALSKPNISEILFKTGTAPFVRTNTGKLKRVDYRRLETSDILAMANALTGGKGEHHYEGFFQSSFSYSIPGFKRYRVHIFKQRGTLAISMKVISREIPDLKMIDIPAGLKRFLQDTSGMIIFAGQADGGLHYTTAAIINYMNKHLARSIMTLENPIRYLQDDQNSSIMQREVGTDIKSISDGLDSVLSINPDIIFISDLDNIEDFHKAVKLAEAGKMVMATMLTNSTIQTLSWIHEVTPPHLKRWIRNQLTKTLRCIMAQKTVRGKDKSQKIFIFELFVKNKDVEHIITDEHKLNELQEYIHNDSLQAGNQSFDKHLITLYKQGLISGKTALDYADNASWLEKQLMFNG